MPHMVISYSQPLAQQVNLQKMVQAVWDASDKTGLFSPGAIKVRALPVEHYRTRQQ